MPNPGAMLLIGVLIVAMTVGAIWSMTALDNHRAARLELGRWQIIKTIDVGLLSRRTRPSGIGATMKHYSQRAIKACAEWLAYCLSIGWSRASLDELEKIWWQHHDKNGRLVK